ncbi:putative genetic interactor of prohibitin 5, mitochondrial [[Candida] jaroonii]|uniref:Genetic interactor of prohibitin 5, mitochondrial n=1 Tax=[Candida] jaroonii TaxID=467808 RepID=A0ACA9YEJ4_9ASCO|nr:putative genetic interactor of prohibitin 5, mitochondrial [[Candida] jaroonii]
MSGLKNIITKIRRLPIDGVTLQKLKDHVKKEFKKPQVDSRKLRRAHRIMDDIIDNENWSAIAEVLDYVYKTVEGKKTYPQHYRMIEIIKGMNYDDARWIPQTHLLKELKINDKLHNAFDNDLAMPRHVLEVDENADTIELLPLKSKSPKNNLLPQLMKFYEFLGKSSVTHLKLPPFNVVYPPNRFGKPMHIIDRDKILNTKLKYIKTILQYRPISEYSLQELNKVLDYQIPINEYFFKYMVRKDRIIGKKKLIPTDKNIVKIYRQYLMKQFYIQNGYKMNVVKV